MKGEWLLVEAPYASQDPKPLVANPDLRPPSSNLDPKPLFSNRVLKPPSSNLDLKPLVANPGLRPPFANLDPKAPSSNRLARRFAVKRGTVNITTGYVSIENTHSNNGSSTVGLESGKLGN